MSASPAVDGVAQRGADVVVSASSGAASSGISARDQPVLGAGQQLGEGPRVAVADGVGVGSSFSSAYSRTVSSIPKRPSLRVSRLWSASAAMPSSAAGPQTASAAASVKPPLNTPSWLNSVWASGSSRS